MTNTAMGKLFVSIDENLEFQFREMALKKFRKGRGIISLAAGEAIQDWVQKQKKVNY